LCAAGGSDMKLWMWVSAVALALGAAGCGGDGKADAPPAGGGGGVGSATLGAEGGTVSGADGAAVFVPAGAASAPVTIRIAKDATDMPALPPRLTAVGDVWAVTPHGAVFSEAVQVRLPRAVRAMAANERLRIAKVSPGGDWELLDPAVTDVGLAVSVRSFSYFVPVAEGYAQATATTPPLAVTVQSATCDPGPCNAVGPDSTELTVVANTDGGALPLGCGTASLSLLYITQAGGIAGITHVGPAGYTLSANPSSYTFRARMSPVRLTQADGSRAGEQSGLLQLFVLCSGPPGVSSVVGSTSVVFPAKAAGNGATEPQFAIAITSQTCNAGVCLNLMGTQSVRVTVRVEPGALASSTCPGTEELALVQGYWGTRTTLARAERALASAGSPARLVGGDFSFGVPAAGLPDSFNLLAPVPVANVPLYIVRQCSSAAANTLPSFLRTLYFPFVTPQQATPPAFSTQPRPTSVRAGQTANFTAVLTGVPAPTLQWQTRLRDTDPWAEVPGATAGTLTTAPSTLADTGRQFKLVASNTSGSVESNVVTLSVYLQDTVPVISHQPTALSVVTGSDAAFAVAASGTGALSYQWHFNGQPITGANAPVLKLPAVAAGSAGRYSIAISNAAGTVLSDEAQLTVSPTEVPVAPTIVRQSAATRVSVGSSSTVAVSASGTAPLAYEWLRDGVALGPLHRGPMFTLAPTSVGVASYTVRVSNAVGSVMSEPISVTVTEAAPAPLAVQITTAPAPQVVLPMGAATFVVAVSGTGPIGYQWLKDGTPIAGATAAVLTLPSVTAADEGPYSVTVSNALGSVTSAAAELIVVGAPAITTQPAPASAMAGDSATFTVAASGPGLRYQWLLGGVPIAGANDASYTTPALTPADSGGVYSVVVYNGAGLVFSQGALLTVSAAPQSAQGKLAALYAHACAITANGQVLCWGKGDHGQLGDGRSTHSSTPVRAAGISNAEFVATGYDTSCAIHGGGQLACWGLRAGSATPVSLGTGGVAWVAVGQYHACYVTLSGGTVWCFGRNDQGQLGDGTQTLSDVPVQVKWASGAALTGAVSVAAAGNSSCATLADGQVWCWGANVASAARLAPVRLRRLNYDGQLFDLTISGHAVAGAAHYCAIDASSARSVCWGMNFGRQLGDYWVPSVMFTPDSPHDDATPTEQAETGPLQLAGGGGHSCSLDYPSGAGSTLRCWGRTYFGNGAGLETLGPTASAGLVNHSLYFNAPVHAVAAGGNFTCALRSGAVMCWGDNSFGQLGNGNTTLQTVPTMTSLGAVFWTP
jgi:hypothetical protein